MLSGWGGGPHALDGERDDVGGGGVLGASGLVFSPVTSQMQSPPSITNQHHTEAAVGAAGAAAGASPHHLHAPISISSSVPSTNVCTLRVLVLNDCFLSPSSFLPLMVVIKASRGEGGLAVAGGDSVTHSADKIPLELLCLKGNIFTETQKAEMSYVAHRRYVCVVCVLCVLCCAFFKCKLCSPVESVYVMCVFLASIPQKSATSSTSKD